jgi:hypothetical protein
VRYLWLLLTPGVSLGTTEGGYSHAVNVCVVYRAYVECEGLHLLAEFQYWRMGNPSGHSSPSWAASRRHREGLHRSRPGHRARVRHSQYVARTMYHSAELGINLCPVVPP